MKLNMKIVAIAMLVACINANPLEQKEQKEQEIVAAPSEAVAVELAGLPVEEIKLAVENDSARTKRQFGFGGFGGFGGGYGGGYNQGYGGHGHNHGGYGGGYNQGYGGHNHGGYGGGYNQGYGGYGGHHHHDDHHHHHHGHY